MTVPEGMLTPPADDPIATPPGETPPAEPREGEEPEGGTPAPKPAESKSARDERIARLTREKNDERQKREAAEAELAALKRRDAAGARPEPPDLTTLTNAEGHLDPAKYKRAMTEYEDKLHTWREAQKAPSAASSTSADADAGAQEALATFIDRAAPLREQHADFDEVVNRPVFTPEMRAALFESELGPALAYHLGTNQAEALRIGNLPPAQLYREMGKLEAKLAAAAPAAPAPRTVSGAPEPITPVRGATPSTRDPEKMTTEEFMAWDRARTTERMKANPIGL